MVAKLVLALVFLAVVTALFGVVLFFYLTRRAELNADLDRLDREFEHEERTELFNDDDL